jgi:hypothetical protein
MQIEKMEAAEVLENLESLKKRQKIKKTFAVAMIFVLFFIIIFLGVSVYSYFQSPEKTIGIGANIENVLLSAEGKTAYIKLEGGSLDKNITKIKFIFTDAEGEHVYETTQGISEIEVPFKRSFWDWLFGRQFTGEYDYQINSENIGLSEFNNINQINVLFEYGTETGVSVTTPTLDTTKPVNQTRTTWGGGDGGSDGGTTTVTCIPESTATTCGADLCGVKKNNCNEDVNCGSCNSGYECQNGICKTQFEIQGLVAYYKFEGNVDDETGVNNGTEYGNPEYELRRTNDYAIKLNGANGVRVNDSDSLDITDEISLLAWVKYDKFYNHGKIIIKAYNETDNINPYELYTLDLKSLGGNYTPAFIITNGIPSGEGGIVRDYSNNISLDTWCHVAGTYNGSLMSLYLNRELIATSEANFTIGTNDKAFFIGGVEALPYKTNGSIDEVMIYNRALNESEIRQIYNAQKPAESGGFRTNISQFGITWFFDKNLTTNGALGTYQYGTFANGDYWVVGLVTIISIEPLSADVNGRTMNGAMVNPSPKDGQTQGYDSAVNTTSSIYDANYNVALNVSAENPLVLQPNSSLVSTISWPEAGRRPQLKVAAVLTILDEAAPEGSFRPPYSGADKTPKFNISQLDYSKLANLTAPASVLTLHKDTLDDPNDQDETVERMFERVWLEHPPGWYARYIHPSENMPDYGREMAVQIGDGALMLHLDFTNAQKKTLLIRFVQLGIDLYGIVQDGGKDNWKDAGGHTQGRKLPILFAGLVLNDANMKAIGDKSGDYLYSGVYGSGNPPPDYIHFNEDDQTFYVTDADIYSSPYELNHIHNQYVNHGTVNVVNGSTTITGISTSWTSIKAVGNYFAVVGGKEAEQGYGGYQYKVVSVDVGSQTLEVNASFQGYTANNVNYVIAGRTWFGHGWYGNHIDYREYTNQHKGMPEWGIYYSTNPNSAGLDWDAYYRGGKYWGGHVLAPLIMGAKSLWNHDVFFDYVDRWMYVEQSNPDKQRSLFTRDMWDTYRANYGCIWNDIKKYNCSNEIVDCILAISCSTYPNQKACFYNPCNLENCSWDGSSCVSAVSGSSASLSPFTQLLNFLKGLLTKETGKAILTGNAVNETNENGESKVPYVILGVLGMILIILIVFIVIVKIKGVKKLRKKGGK